ncbi:terpenoid synthase [Apiospora hydei]|uniref:Terpenoid synthase n=1 Tax=Apiospora hydei TaxID=1337664 RepID=A0ABR1WME0_9PEZI
MEFRYSSLVDPRHYQTHGLANGIPLRQHDDSVKERAGALRAQRDWGKFVFPIQGYNGGLGDRFSLIRVTIPECLPERLEIISYANEFAFLYDGANLCRFIQDAMEEIDLKDNLDGDAVTIPFLETFGAETVLDVTPKVAAQPEKRLQAQILAEMMSIDPIRAITTMEVWGRFVRLASETRARPFGTMTEYVPSRVVDVGELIWFGTLTFAMALTIPEEDLQECMELARPAYAALALTNDLYSWDKERKAAEETDQDYVFNAIWVIMKERSVSEKEAKNICCEEIRKYVQEYCEIVEEVQSEPAHLGKDTRTYLEAIKYTISGNLVWSIYCARYNDF